MTCPRQFAFQYIEREPTPLVPVMLLGTSIHKLFERSLKVLFKSSETFVNTWIGQWGRVVNGVHGPSQLHLRKGAAPKPVNLPNREAVLSKYYGWGRKAMTQYHQLGDNEEVRGRPKKLWPTPEEKFTFAWNDFLLRGAIDRTDRHGSYIMWDYKMTAHDPVLAAQDLQFTMYTLKALHQDGVYPDAFKVYSYMSGELQTIPGRTAADIDHLYSVLQEATIFSEVARVGRPFHPTLERPHIRHFTVQQIEAAERGMFLPILPECPIAKQCRYATACAAWQVKYARQLPLTDQTLIRWALDRKALVPDQLVLPFLETLEPTV